MSEQELKLKISAMKEAFGTMASNYEDKVADLRVQLTIVSTANDALSQKLEEAIASAEALEKQIDEIIGRYDDSQATAEDDDTA
jgi:uncharacterized protein YeeX (DUF496 family)